MCCWINLGPNLPVCLVDPFWRNGRLICIISWQYFFLYFFVKKNGIFDNLTILEWPCTGDVRYFLHYIINYLLTYLPSGPCVIVSWISFLIPCDAAVPGHNALLLFFFLSWTIYLTMSQQILIPKPKIWQPLNYGMILTINFAIKSIFNDANQIVLLNLQH